MLDFMKSGVHLKAMKAFHSIATGRTYGYETDRLPDWDEAFSMLMSKGKNYQFDLSLQPSPINY